MNIEPDKFKDNHGLTDNNTFREIADTLAKDMENNATLVKILGIISKNDPLENLLYLALDALLSVSWLNILPKGGIFLANNEKKILQLIVKKNLHPALHTLCSQINFGHCLCGRAAATGKVQYTKCIDERHDIQYTDMAPHGHYNVPIFHDVELLGVLVVYLPHGHDRDELEIKFLENISRALGMLIQVKNKEKRLIKSKKQLEKNIHKLDVKNISLEQQATKLTLLYEEQSKICKEAEILEQKAHLANKAKTDFLANMSHELRTPLNAIIGFSEMMTQDGFVESSADKVREYCTDINMSGRHLLQIINDILDLSKIEAGMADIVLEPIYLEDSIQECVKFIELRAADAEITIFNEVRDTPARILVDKRMFKQVIVNILSNSVKFTPQGGNIHISFALNKKGETTISITDTGIGIAEADIATVMEPFHQADSSLSRNFEGTGLGLPLVKSLMEIHGGRIDLKSRTGVGTTVSITFPPHSSITAE